MLTNLPIRPRSLNSTTPVTLANRVSSLPQPTLAPGFNLVPRWRTMMLPPGTNWPPKTLMPSRCAFESRPFLELPRPFLCAIRYLHHHFANLHFRVGLTVSDGFLVLFLALELEDQDLGCPVCADDGARHFAAGNQFAAFFERCLDGKLDFRADVAGQFFDADHITGGYPILFSACLDTRVHADRIAPPFLKDPLPAGATSEPMSPASFSTRITSPGAPRYCFPPVSIIACM